MRLSDQELSARAAANIARILREAISNIIKHANADRVEVTWSRDSDHLFVRVSDNGKGETLDGQGDGHGLRTMQVRAEDLGGRVDCRVLAEGGFVVELTLPAA